jgi:hypothetical protein
MQIREEKSVDTKINAKKSVVFYLAISLVSLTLSSSFQKICLPQGCGH